ncbi:MAG: BatA domain-containing protein [Verrucomicrobiota bacterium]
MTFAYPLVFLLLIPATLLLVWNWMKRRRDAITFSSIQAVTSVPKSRRQKFGWLPDAARALAVLLAIVALARPQTEKYESSLEREGVAIELLVDISSSMDMRMKQKGGRDSSRLNVAKQVILDFIQGNSDDLKGRSDDLIGMITFARYADTVCPLTLSHEALIYLTDAITINDRPNEDGTAYGDATALAAARLARLEERLQKGDKYAPAKEPIASKIIVLLTDGENNCGRMLPLQAAALAKEWGIKIYTISLTDPPKSQFVKVDTEETIEAARVRSAAERGLEKMAEMTGGIFRTAYDYDTLQAVYEEIDNLERSKMRSTLKTVPQERFQIFALMALLLVGTELGLVATWLRQIP